MPALNPQIAFDAEPVPAAAVTAPRGDVVALGDHVVFVESPARLLHERLSDHFAATAAAPDDRWPLFARVAFIAGATLALWGALGGVAILLA